MQLWRSKKTLYYILTVVAFLGIGMGLYTDTSILIVNQVQIDLQKTDLHALVQKEVRERIQSKVHAFHKQNILAVPIGRIQQQILSDVWVESVTIERNYPDKLQVRVTLKNVVFVYLDKRGRFLPLSEQGQLLNPVEPAFVPDVPLIRNPEIIKNPELLKRILILFKEIPREGLFSQESIAEVDWSKSEGLVVENADVEGGRIVLGKDKVHSKAARITTVLKYLESQNQKWRVIDASFKKKVLVRLRKHS